MQHQEEPGNIWSSSSVGQNAPLSRVRSRVRVPSAPPTCKTRLKWREQLEQQPCPCRLARPRTPPFQGENTGSNPVRDAKHRLRRIACDEAAHQGNQFRWSAPPSKKVPHCANSGRGTGCRTTASAWLSTSKPRLLQRNPQGEVAILLGQVWGLCGAFRPP